MKRDLIEEGLPVHIIRRGARGIPFNKDDSDRWRNLQGLYFLNDVSCKNNWMRDVEEKRFVDIGCQQQKKEHFFSWPKLWPERKPLISLWAFTFSGNHDHIIASVKEEKGLSKFMQKWNISTAKHFNDKYKEKGTVFQGPYVLRVIDSEDYLYWVIPYVMVKNTFEMHERGYDWAVNNFEEAWEWAIKYPFSSLGDYVGKRNSPIIDSSHIKELMGGLKEFKNLCEEMILNRKEMEKEKTEEMEYYSYET